MVAKSLAGFTADLNKFAEQIGVDVRLARKKVAFDIFGNVVKRSPVDTGRFRGSWTMADTTPDTTVQPENQESYPIPNAADQGAAFSLDFDVTHITNALPYAERLEFGWSRQAGHGVARIAVAEAEAEIDSLIK